MNTRAFDLFNSIFLFLRISFWGFSVFEKEFRRKMSTKRKLKVGSSDQIGEKVLKKRKDSEIIEVSPNEPIPTTSKMTTVSNRVRREAKSIYLLFLNILFVLHAMKNRKYGINTAGSVIKKTQRFAVQHVKSHIIRIVWETKPFKAHL